LYDPGEAAAAFSRSLSPVPPSLSGRCSLECPRVGLRDRVPPAPVALSGPRRLPSGRAAPCGANARAIHEAAATVQQKQRNAASRSPSRP